MVKLHSLVNTPRGVSLHLILDYPMLNQLLPQNQFSKTSSIDGSPTYWKMNSVTLEITEV
jgi:hypothetical protein